MAVIPVQQEFRGGGAGWRTTTRHRRYGRTAGAIRLWAASVGRLVPGVTRQAFRKHNPASAQILADWEIIVGPKVASMTVPRRLDRGMLTIACAGAGGDGPALCGVEVINRINTHLGGQPVHSLKFHPGRHAARAAPLPPPRRRKRCGRPRPRWPICPTAICAAALAALGRVVIGRSKHSTRRLNKL